MNDKIEQFISLLRSQVNKGTYVYGANGQDLLAMENPLEWIRKKETSAADADRAIHLYEARKKNGVNPIRAFDCSGLMYWAGKQLGVFTYDVSSRNIYALCAGIQADDLQAGDFIFRTDENGIVRHVGMYIGEDKYIDDAGRDIGVREDKFKVEKWKLFGRLPALSGYDPKPDPEPEPSSFVRVKGKKTRSVCIRAGIGRNAKLVHIAHGGDEFPLIRQAADEPQWYNINFNGRTDTWITNGPKYTEVIEHA